MSRLNKPPIRVIFPVNCPPVSLFRSGISLYGRPTAIPRFNSSITLIPFNKYRTDKAIKVIKKYASLGVKYFILDTFKADSGSRNDKMWLEMQIIIQVLATSIIFFACPILS